MFLGPSSDCFERPAQLLVFLQSCTYIVNVDLAYVFTTMQKIMNKKNGQIGYYCNMIFFMPVKSLGQMATVTSSLHNIS